MGWAVEVTSLPNPERAWERAPQLSVYARSEVERRLGPTPPTNEPLDVLTGGLANVNIRVGSRRVLRIYRRNRLSAGKEAALLRQPWTSFVVPGVLETGADFIVIDYVPHRELGGSHADGAAVGQALAEIHRTRFSETGFLDDGLHVSQPFQDILEAFETHALVELGKAALPATSDLPARVGAFLCAERAALRLAAGLPVLLHGDFKASNLHRTVDDRLLVLDWEFAYSGPALMDIGQLLRWHPPPDFVSAFSESYQQHGGKLPEGWRRWAAAFDLFNLVSLLDQTTPDSQRSRDVQERIEETLGLRYPAVP